jgi:DNA recombination protein RmuC
MELVWFMVGGLVGAAIVALAMRARVVALRADAGRERERGEERVAALAEANQRLETTFKALSADALASNNRQFLDLAKTTLERYQTEARSDLDKREKAVAELVAPIRESLTKVDGQLQTLDRDRRRSQGELDQHLRSLAQSHDRLRSETSALVAALRQPQTRGRWGEMQLRRVVEMAGMVSHCDFTEQTHVTDADGRALRPDLVLHMPGGRHVVVDAKAPLTAFLDAYEATDETQRELHLRSHARLLREHIRSLSSKSYWAQFSPAPDFVFLFLPGEHFLNAALEADPGLIEQGVDSSVLIATPTTLIALLRAVGYGWQQERVAESARQIGELGRELYERVAKFGDHMGTLGKRLGSAVNAYNEAVGSLESRVLVSARKLADQGVSAGGREIAEPTPIDQTARALQAAELTVAMPVAEPDPPDVIDARRARAS